MFEPLYTAAEMRAAEERYPSYPETAGELMERAGRAVAEEALWRWPEASRYAVVCGKGSNGGDGRIAARLLREAGREVVEEAAGRPEVVVDALFGTGFRGAPRAEAARLIEWMNAQEARRLAVDVPSGVDASTGEVPGAAFRADVTVTFHAPKVGLLVSPGRLHAGEAVVADIGLEHVPTELRLVTDEAVELIPRRREGQTKYSAGSVLVVGGSRGMSGAVCLTAEAAFRADAGYVSVAAPLSVVPVLEQRVLEAVKRPCPEDEEGRLTLGALDVALAAAERASAVAIGPGLGRSHETKELVRRLLAELDKPVVLDADALFELAPFERTAATVLTPHSGELARLLGEESAWVDAHRLDAVRRGAERFGAVCLLKGADTLVTAPDAPVHVCSAGTPALATAGTGDVLTGVLAACLAKGLAPRLAAVAAATLHGLAARLAPHQGGLVAGDVAANLPQALG